MFIKDAYLYSKNWKPQSNIDYSRRFVLGRFGLRIYLFISALKWELNRSEFEYEVYRMKCCYGHDGINGRKMNTHKSLLESILIYFRKNV